MLAWAPPGAEIIYAGKKAGAHTLPQEASMSCSWKKQRPANAWCG